MGGLTVNVAEYFEDIINEFLKIGFIKIDISVDKMKRIEKTIIGDYHSLIPKMEDEFSTHLIYKRKYADKDVYVFFSITVGTNSEIPNKVNIYHFAKKGSSMCVLDSDWYNHTDNKYQKESADELIKQIKDVYNVLYRKYKITEVLKDDEL